MIRIFFTLSDSIFVSFFSVLIVFFILSIIALSIQSLKYIHEKPKTIITPHIQVKKPTTLSDITDDDMMVAALIASIDYQLVTKGDVKVISIKEIKE